MKISENLYSLYYMLYNNISFHFAAHIFLKYILDLEHALSINGHLKLFFEERHSSQNHTTE